MRTGTIDPKCDYVTKLSTDTGRDWQAIASAKAQAEEVYQLLYRELRTFTSDDVDLVVFGSLARREWTSGSDVDWTLLIDGQANSEHRVAAREVERKLSELTYRGNVLKGPGGEGIFGNMVFSHEIVHHIGGQADTNRNTTQRILLLLEATPLGRMSGDLGGPCERIVRQVLNRYLASDSNFHSKTDHNSRIPRFLLNDIVRYWRTMCVDFAYKDWEQDGKKWALRNIKLRTSRKLLFVAGYLTIFSCFKNESLNRLQSDDDDYVLRLQGHLLDFVHSTPLNIMIWSLQNLDMTDECVGLVNLFEEMLALLDDPSVRKTLEGLAEDDVYNDGTFMKCRGISHRIQEILTEVCFEKESPLRDFTREYGVF